MEVYGILSPMVHRTKHTTYYIHTMQLFAPKPTRLVDISSLIEAFSEKYVAPICLRWSSLTFGIKKLSIQLLTVNDVDK